MAPSLFRPIAKLAPVGILAALALTACVPPPDNGGNGDRLGPKPSALRPFASDAELLSYLKSQTSTSGRQTSLLEFGTPAVADAAAGAGGEAAPAEAAVSSLNIQEEGVDEADVVRTDGDYLYIARGTSLFIVSANGTELRSVGRVDLDHGIDSLYLHGDSVLILSGGGGRSPLGAPEIMIWPPFYPAGTLTVTQVDVSDRANPFVVQEVELDGSLANSRLTADRLILVVTIVPNIPQNASAAAINRLTLAELMPQARHGGLGRALVDGKDWLRPDVPSGTLMTAIITLSADDITKQLGSLAVVGGIQTLYATRQSIYLTQASYLADDSADATAIHKFAMDEQTLPHYVASGTAPGSLLNQFSLSEHNGFLRVATTIHSFVTLPDVVDLPIRTGGGGSGSAGSVGATQPADASSVASAVAVRPTSSNAVFVMAEAEGKLDVVGRAVDLAPDEIIYAARFIGERGFLVTFRRIDPLFVLDLSDPTNPVVTGELKIPGYSDYLHPFRTDRLIGVGRSAIPNGFGGAFPAALQLSMFDVSSMTSPALVQQIELGGMRSQSDVSLTHKAFTLEPTNSLLAIPATLSDPRRSLDSLVLDFDGVLCFQVDGATGLTELGRVAAIEADGRALGGSALWRRGVIIDGVLYAVTPGGVRAASVRDFGTVNELRLPD
jgi:inhibitor of cysteine peptidase